MSWDNSGCPTAAADGTALRTTWNPIIAGKRAIALGLAIIKGGGVVKVFISWSGEISRRIATKLYDWLPMVLQSVQPYMSAESIDKGTRWASSISGELEDTSVGIVVVTPDNIHAPWIYFESGALAKSVGDSRLAPLLCGLKPSDIGTPLSQFQVTVFNKEDVLKLLKSINSVAGEDALPEARLEKAHNLLWPDLLDDVTPLITAATPNDSPANPPPSPDDTSRILEELLVLTRQQAQTILSPEKLITRELIKTIVEIAAEQSSASRNPGEMRAMARALYTRWRDLRAAIEADQNLSNQEALAALLVRVEVVIRDIVETNDRGSRAHGRPYVYEWSNHMTKNLNVFATPLKSDSEDDS